MTPSSTLVGTEVARRRSRAISRLTSARAMSTSPMAVTIGSSSLQLEPGRGPQQRSHLRAQQPRTVEPEADRAPAQRRVLLLRLAQIGQHLVAADVEGAEHHRLLPGFRHHRAVHLCLLLEPRQGGRHHELQLGAEQADAVGAGFGKMRHVHQQSGIDVQLDRAGRPWSRPAGPAARGTCGAGGRGSGPCHRRRR